VVLYLFDAADPPEELYQNLKAVLEHAREKAVLVVANKIDQATADPTLPQGKYQKLSISAKNGTGMDALQHALIESVGVAAINNNDVIVTNSRHYEALQKALEAVHRVQDGITNQVYTDLLAEDVREALKHLGNITGEIEPDRDILGTIFSKFCIGK
jgi:tRNA modification GTPase